MTTAISASTGTQFGNQSSSASSLSQLGEDYSRFLTLLTAQIANQDPLAPMDSTEFVSQLAQLSQVEQAVNTNSNLEGLQSQITSLLTINGAEMIGRTVTVPSNQAELLDGTTDAFYSLPTAAAQVTAEIRDPLDRVVGTLTGLSGEAGTLLPLSWNGEDEFGNYQLEGMYSVTITAVDGEGNELPVHSFRSTEVTEVLYAGGQLYFGLSGDETVAAEHILGAS